jgi:hypothetical protein
MSENEACLLKSPTRTPWNKGKFGRGGVRVDLIDAALRWHWEGALSACPGSGAKINCRGRDAHCCAPPAQIRTCPIKAYGSHLG